MSVELTWQVALLATHAYVWTAHFTQHAGLEALSGSQAEVEAILFHYHQRRDRLVGGFNQLPGVRCEILHGAFYAFPNIQGLIYPRTNSTIESRKKPVLHFFQEPPSVSVVKVTCV